MSLRASKKLKTFKLIQEKALQLFSEKGFDATSVEEIAAAAEVSHMTFFRYFPTKESVVLQDEYDAFFDEALADLPKELPISEQIQLIVLSGLQSMSAADLDRVKLRLRLALQSPSLQTKLWENQLQQVESLIEMLSRHNPEVEQQQLRVLATALIAVLSEALLRWAHSGFSGDIATSVRQNFAYLHQQL